MARKRARHYRQPAITTGNRFRVSVDHAIHRGCLGEALLTFLNKRLKHKSPETRIWFGHELFRWVLPHLPRDEQERVVKAYCTLFPQGLPDALRQRHVIWMRGGEQPSFVEKVRHEAVPEVSPTTLAAQRVRAEALERSSARLGL
jgi:hypothetical protein